MIALVVVLIAGGAALLVKQQVDAGPELERANSEANTAYTELTGARERHDLALATLDAVDRRYQDEIAGTGDTGAPGYSQLAQALGEQRNAVKADADAAQRSVIEAQRVADRANLRAQEAQRAAATRSGYWALFALAAFVAALLATMWVGYVRSERRREWENKRLLHEGEQSIPDDRQIEFIDLWHRNQHRLQEYHQIVLNHTQSSRQLTHLVLVAGFLLVGALGVLAWLASDVMSSVATSVAAAAGATVTAFVARTVLRNAETSTSEVNQFFRNPLEMERILTAERLIGMMAETERDAARQLVVRGLVERALPTKDVPADREAQHPPE